ncbi:inositol monophosphatase family protein [Bacillus luteolus]|uniref:inositol-phosphate phosphatase n=1 Tax=Litchfieldia luteola TaxID=682179 RepID=A0ABR9QK63_9BACI|nr:inositol monophosphatase family protein [Cytobacillus luteolus]MBE4908882.1 inositol monophosphatase family protein [Cytobacillus luteolus]MBP1941740.1 myo-inositol-1(or 4)-monophosphatase [Cytobacillus luteolus]
MGDLNEMYRNGVKWTREAGKRIRDSFQTKLTIHTKSNADDLVTNIDRETEQFFIQHIKASYPTHKIMGEEGFGDKLESLQGFVWIIDPIDGTMNFIHQQRNFAISVALYEDGVGKFGMVYDVVHDELYHAIRGNGAFLNDDPIPELPFVELNKAILGINATWVTDNKRIDSSILAPLVKSVRGTRSYGAATLEFVYVVTGRLDAYISMRLSPWDFAAGAILIEEVGGIVTTLDGNSLNFLGENTILVTNKSLHKTIVEDYVLK